MTIEEMLITIADNTPLVAEAVNNKKSVKDLFEKNPVKYSGSCNYKSDNGRIIVITTTTGRYVSTNFKLSDGDELVGKRVTISAEWQASGQNTGAARLIWTDNTNLALSVGQIGGVANSGGSATYTIPPKPAKAGALCLFLYGNYEGTGGTGNTVTYRNVRVTTEGDSQAYEEAISKANEIKTALLKLKEELL